MILVDSSVWINYFNGIKSWQTDLLDQLLSNTQIIIGELILIEVLQGFRSDEDYKMAKSYLSVLPFRPMGSSEIAVKSGQNYRFLRKKGITVRKTIDVIIATFCMIEELTLLHDDRDFDQIVSCLPIRVVSQR